jgi:hypothetical protein
MSISRRSALSGAAALAAMSGGAGSSFAGMLHAKRNGRARNLSGTQAVLDLLIHRDEHGHAPHREILYIPSPDAAWYAVDTMDAVKYRMTNHYYRLRGYRLKRVSAFNTAEGVRYSAIWQQAAGPEWVTRHNMTRESFETHNADYARDGMRVVHLDARQRYAAVWERGDVSTQQVVTGLSLGDFEAKLAELTAQDYRPARISTTTAVGQPQFAAVFEKNDGRAWQSRHELSATDFRKVNTALGAEGYRLFDASGHMQNGKARLAGIWEQA